jgi:hypothetical protein
VDVADLRLPSAQSRAQAGPLAELARLRAQAGKSTSKPKKVKVTVPNPLMPRVVSGFVGSQMVMPPFESLWSGQVRFEAVETQDGAYTVRYRLASASLAWSVESQQPGCLIKGEGTFSEADLKGEGWIDVSPMKGGKTGYRFTITRETPVTLDVTCGSQKTQYETDQELFILNTLDCPSGGTVGSTYTGQPWTNRKPPFVFFGKLGLNAASFCSSTLTPPGSFQSWELTGSELFEFADGLAPIAK